MLSVLFVPQGNTERLTVESSTSVQDVLTHVGATGTFKVLLDGTQEIAKEAYASTSIAGVSELWIVEGSKGA